MSDIVVLLTTFLLTIFVDLTVAVAFGMILALFLFMKSMTTISEVTSLKEKPVSERNDVEPIMYKELASSC